MFPSPIVSRREYTRYMGGATCAIRMHSPRGATSVPNPSPTMADRLASILIYVHDTTTQNIPRIAANMRQLIQPQHSCVSNGSHSYPVLRQKPGKCSACVIARPLARSNFRLRCRLGLATGLWLLAMAHKINRYQTRAKPLYVVAQPQTTHTKRERLRNQAEPLSFSAPPTGFDPVSSA